MKTSREEVLRYLGYNNQIIDNSTAEIIDECLLEIQQLTQGKYTYKLFELAKTEGKMALLQTNLVFSSVDIQAHLAKSTKCVLLAATFGMTVEKRIYYYSKLNLTKAVILDACASAFIEAVCDEAEKEIQIIAQEQGYYLTSRYSPGYGDFPLEVQPQIIKVLDAYQKIGLSATENYLLLPRKSVTALIGLQKEPSINKNVLDKCQACPNLDCPYRKEGKDCAENN